MAAAAAAAQAMNGLRRRIGGLIWTLPERIGSLLPAPSAAATACACARAARRGYASTVGYFPSSAMSPDAVEAGNLALIAAVRETGACLALKAPPLGFDEQAIARIAAAARKAGLSLVFDALAPAQAGPTLDLAAKTAGAGLVLPARWRRSTADAARFRESAARVRLVKGEWPDSEGSDGDPAVAFLALARLLAGRRATVGVATHDPALAREALAVLLAAGTPCELEQLRGLPCRRSVAAAHELGVPVRFYFASGPGWWPYALGKTLERPYLPNWWLADRLGRPGTRA